MADQVLEHEAVNAVLNSAQAFQVAATESPADVDRIRAAVARVRRDIDAVKIRAFAAEVVAAAKELQAVYAASSQDPSKVLAAVEKVRGVASNKLPAAAIDDADREIDAYRIATNLLSINNNNPLHKTILADWEQKAKDLFKKVSRRQARSADLTNQIYNIIGWFAVFQGVVLTAVSQLTQTKTTGGIPLCGKIWFPIILTGFGTLVTSIGILIKFRGLKSLENTIHKEKEAQIEVEKRINELRRKGPQGFRFSQDLNDDKESTVLKSYWWDGAFVIGALLVYTVLFILSYLVILCDSLVVRRWDGGILHAKAQ